VPAKDPYWLLGVSRGASEDEIRKSYRRLVREHHPDANPEDPSAEERFKEIQHAYEVLSDPRKRREHDEKARPSSGPSSGRAHPRTGGRAGRRTVRADNLSDFFNKLGDLSYQRTSEHKEFSRELRGEDLARFAKLLGIPLDRVLSLVGEHVKARGSVSFGGSRPGAPSAEDEKPPVADKPPVPPKPPKTAKPDDFS
jgi:curved DNA-binding protein CbpA